MILNILSLCTVHLRRFSYLSLLLFGNLHSDGCIFPFLLCLLLLFFCQLFVSPSQTPILSLSFSFFFFHADRIFTVGEWGVCVRMCVCMCKWTGKETCKKQKKRTSGFSLVRLKWLSTVPKSIPWKSQPLIIFQGSWMLETGSI